VRNDKIPPVSPFDKGGVNKKGGFDKKI